MRQNSRGNGIADYRSPAACEPCHLIFASFATPLPPPITAASSVLQKLVLEHRPISVSIKELIAAAELPWEAQEAAVFN